MKRNCYFCNKKKECYTENGLAKLTLDDVTDCGDIEQAIDEAIEKSAELSALLLEIKKELSKNV